MRHQKLHLIRQYTAIAQDEIFPQAWHVRGVKQRHTGLLGRAAAFAVVAGAAGRDHIHPCVDALLGKRNDVFTRQVLFIKMLAAVGAHIPVAREQFDVGQARFEFKWVDFRHTLGPDDAVNSHDGLLARDRVVAAVKGDHASAHFPAHLVSCVMQHGFFKADPRLWQPLGG